MLQKTKFKQTEIGKIPEDWEVKKIGDLVSINETSIGKGYAEKQIEYIDISSVENGTLLGTQKLKLSEAPSRAKRIVKSNDILISTVRPNLKHYYFIEKSKDNLIASTGFVVITSKKITPRFLYYYLTTDKYTDFLSAIADTHTSAYPSFNPGVIKNSLCPYPSELEQETIVKILSDLDSKIELNRQMSKTLEQIAQTIFKQWFVDFEFPDENGKPYKTSGGEMEDSILGEIPKGWTTGKFSDIATNFDSKRIPLSRREREKRKGRYPYYGATGILDYVDDYIFDGIYVLMGEDGTVIDDYGYPIIQYIWGKFWVNNHAHVLQGRKYFSQEYIFLLLRNTTVHHIVTGAVQPKINQNNMNSLNIVLPSKDVINSFNLIIEDLFAKIRQNSEERIKLTQIRDLLTPKIISGQIRLKAGLSDEKQ